MTQTSEEPRAAGAHNALHNYSSQVLPQAGSCARSLAALLPWQEVDRLRVIERVPSPGSLVERLAKRMDDFDLLVRAVNDFLSMREGV